MKITKQAKPLVNVKLFLNGKMVLDRRTRLLKSFNHIIGTNNFDIARLMVTYKPGVTNEGEYTNKKDLIRAKDQFLEKDLVEYGQNFI